jgi:4-hydroxy-tetrahydrodipicolinate reductase
VRAGNGALLWSPNFAVGIHHFAALVEEAARRFLGAGFSAEIVETHHTKKLDAPSGTARLLADRAALGGGKLPPIWSVREGEVVGRHEMKFDAAYEQVRLTHDAIDRRVFAAGALAAAKWLVGKRGVFTLTDLLDGADLR